MKNLKFEDLPKAMETVIEKLTTLEFELNTINKTFNRRNLKNY